MKVVDAIRVKEPRVGTRKLKDRLQKQGVSVGRDHLFGLLREGGKLVRPKRRHTKTTYSRHGYAVAPNRLREIKVTKPGEALVADITYLTLKDGKFAYLYLVTDLFSRKILAARVSADLTHYTAKLAADDALEIVGKDARPLHHSDRGSQYCCHEFLRFLADNGVKSSMTDADHCYQNAVAERVNGILKDEFNLDGLFDSINDAKKAVTAAVETYNSKRTHWTLKLKTPDEVFYQRAA